MKDVIFIKFGGSLITDKNSPLTPKIEVIHSLSDQLKTIKNKYPNLKIILGHGSGSFGHSVAKTYQTRTGVKTEEEWLGFSKVWFAARALNSVVMHALQEINLPSITFPPSTFLNTSNKLKNEIFISTIETALNANLIPVVHGDVIFDKKLGGTILSTEDIFIILTSYFQPKKILLAGIEPFVWEDFPINSKPIRLITPGTFHDINSKLHGSNSTDVTGGMFEKVRIMVELVNKYPGTSISIFSGTKPNCLIDEIENHPAGTLIISEN